VEDQAAAVVPIANVLQTSVNKVARSAAVHHRVGRRTVLVDRIVTV